MRRPKSPAIKKSDKSDSRIPDYPPPPPPLLLLDAMPAHAMTEYGAQLYTEPDSDLTIQPHSTPRASEIRPKTADAPHESR